MTDPIHEAAQRLQGRLRASPGAISILVDRSDLEAVVRELAICKAQSDAYEAEHDEGRRAPKALEKPTNRKRPIGRNERNQKIQ